jgi:hypothetical protein
MVATSASGCPVYTFASIPPPPPLLAEEFGEEKPADEIRACADAVVAVRRT